MRRVSLLLVLLGVMACRPRDVAHVADATPSPAPTPSADTLVLRGPNEPVRAAFTPTGELIVTTPSALLRMPAADGAPATIVPLPERARVTATARAADVTIIQGESTALYIARGRDVTQIKKAALSTKLAIADDGRLFLADDWDAKENQVETGIFEPGGNERALVPAPAFLSPSGGWAAIPGKIISPLANEPATDVSGATPLGWLGTMAVFSTGRDVVLVDPTTHAKKTFATCPSGETALDPIAKRVVVTCDKAIHVIDADTRTVTILRLPITPRSAGYAFVTVSPAATGADLYATWMQRETMTELDFRLDPAARTVTPIPAAPEPERRDFEGRPWGWENGAPSPDGTRWARVVDGGVEVTDPIGHVVATWGAKGGAPFRVAVNGDGIDVGGQSRLRLGPDAPPPSPVLFTRPPDESCPTELHATLATGALWLEHQNPGRPRSCLCDGGTCKDTPHAPFLAALAGRDDALVLATWERGQGQVHVTALDGTERGMVFVPEACRTAITRPDKPIAAVLCRDAVIELDLVTGKEIRRTALPAATANELLAVTDRDVVIQVYGPGHKRDFVRVLDAGTNRVRATVSLWNDAAVVRSDDGAVELFGDTELAARAIRCVKDGVVLPFEACSASRRVHDRFRLY